jgi:hypothetical protein
MARLKISTAAEAIAAGFTRHVFASSSEYDFNLFVRPDADLDGTFEAYDDDGGEMLRVNGWLFTIEEAGPACVADGIMRRL